MILDAHQHDRTRKTKIMSAKLIPEQILRYQQLHDEIPEQIETHMQEAGILSLRIFREDMTLFMIVESDSSLEEKDRYVDEFAEKEWHRLTGACFTEKWKDADEIYTFQGALS